MSAIIVPVVTTRARAEAGLQVLPATGEGLFVRVGEDLSGPEADGPRQRIRTYKVLASPSVFDAEEMTAE